MKLLGLALVVAMASQATGDGIRKPSPACPTAHFARLRVVKARDNAKIARGDTRDAQFAALAEYFTAREALDEVEAAEASCVAEAKRKDDAAAAEKTALRTASEARRRALYDDPVTMRLAWSALICDYEEARREALTEAAKLRRYARPGDQPTDALIAEEHARDFAKYAAEARERLAADKLKPLLCKDADVKAAVACMDAGSTDCVMNEGAELAKMLRR